MTHKRNTGEGSAPTDRDKKRLEYYRGMQRRGETQNPTPNRNQSPAHVSAAAEVGSNQRLGVPPAQRGRESRGSRGRQNARGRKGSPAHSQPTLRNNQGSRPPTNVPSSSPFPPVEETVARQSFHSHLTAEGIEYSHWQSSITRCINGAPYLAETSSVLTRTESTGWSSIDYSSPMEAITPMSEPPEPWPSRSGGHNFVGAGAQFGLENTLSSAEIDRSGNATATFETKVGGSGYQPVIIVTSDGQFDFVDQGGAQNNSRAAEMAAEIDLLSSLPFEMSGADLDWVKNED